jgi:hypothetical protein
VFQLPRRSCHFNKGALSSRAHTDFDYMDKGSAHHHDVAADRRLPGSRAALTYLEGRT